MALDNATFRTTFPEFTDVTKYPDAMLTFWMTFSKNFVDAVKWGDAYDAGLSLVLAHHLVNAFNNQSDPGSGSRLSSGESAGDVSISYDTTNMIEEGGGHWNATSYGKQYLRMARFLGGCARQV